MSRRATAFLLALLLGTLALLGAAFAAANHHPPAPDPPVFPTMGSSEKDGSAGDDGQPLTEPLQTEPALWLPLVFQPGTQQEWLLHKTADGAHPSGHEQQMVWLMNRARADPAQEGVWLATSDHPHIAGPRTYFGVDLQMLQNEFAGYEAHAPAAFDRRLYEAARAHSEDLIRRDAQDHEGQFERVAEAGFVMAGGRGNVFSYVRSGIYGHAGFNIDWGSGPGGMQPGRGHRMAVMSIDGDYTNVGIAAVPEDDPQTGVGPLVVTGNYAHAGQADDHYNVFLVGTVWDDGNDNGMYDPGEGVGGVTVRPDSGPYYAVTADSGGYALPMPEDGPYTISFSAPANAAYEVTIAGESVLLDVALGAD